MATHEPDRSTRRRWFRMPGSQPSDPGVEPVVENQPEASVSMEESPPESTPAVLDDVRVGEEPEPERAPAPVAQAGESDPAPVAAAPTAAPSEPTPEPPASADPPEAVP